MQNKQPFSCRGILVVYNLGLTLLSLYMFYEVGKKIFFYFAIVWLIPAYSTNLSIMHIVFLGLVK